MAAQSADVVNTVRGVMLADDGWLAARIADLEASWRTDSPRVSATLWWCMTASALIEQVVTALARGVPIPVPELGRLALSLRSDGTVEKVRILDADADADADRVDPPHASGGLGDIPAGLRATLTVVIDRITAVSGVREVVLWAVVTDVVASWAVAAHAPRIGEQLAAEIGGLLPTPRFVEVGGRIFVRRASCCLVYEAPGCEKCVSCPKRPPAERDALLADYARRG